MPIYSGQVGSKLPTVGTTIFSVMSKLSQEKGAINLSQGFPNFDVDSELIELIYSAMKNGHNQYAPMQGYLPLREAIGEKLDNLYSMRYNAEDEITITAGATQAIYTAISAFVKEGDEVIIFTPAYDCYAPAVELNGGKTVYFQLHGPEFKIDWEEVKKLVNRKTRMILINTPHNPTGTILSAHDMLQLERITKGSDILILSDEVYEHIIFDGYEHQSVARFPHLAERSLIVYSFGKTFHATGWKLGYIVGPAALMVEFRKVHQFNVFSANTPIQVALAKYIQNENTYIGISSFYQAKRDIFNAALKNSRFILRPSAGTYFQLLDYSNISDQKEVDLAKSITEEIGVASIPVSVFYHNPKENKVLRFCFAKTDETLLEAADRLCKI